MENRHNMANQSYYRFTDSNSNNVENLDVEVQVNCAGEAVLRSEWAHKQTSRRKDYYLIFSEGGDIRGVIDNREVCVKSGNAVCIAPKTPHAFHSNSPLDEWVHYHWIHFTGYGIEKMLSELGIRTNEIYSIKPTEELFSHYEKLFSEFRQRSALFDTATALELKYILYLIASSHKSEAGGRLDKSIRYIHTHIRYDLSVERLAAMEFLGVSRYRELFRAETGVSPSEYILRLRMARAKDLLSQSGADIAGVAESVGYSDRHYFQYMFKRTTGMTPGEYKKNLSR